MAKSYYETQVAKSRKAVADAVAGKGLKQAIRQLQEKARIKDSLADLPARGAIKSRRVIGRRTGAGAGADRVELSRSFYSTTHELRSSDGLLVLQFQNVETLRFDTGTDRFLDFDPATIP